MLLRRGDAGEVVVAAEKSAVVSLLVEEGLVSRSTADGDARGVVVTLTGAGAARVSETVPVHLRAVAELFMAKLDNQELAVLEGALKKVILDCTFG